jgi:uncharacterized membrane protein YccC
MFKVISFLIETINWIRIAISPTLIGIAFGSVFYYFFQTPMGKIIWIICAVIGCIIGVIWASRIWRKLGTTTFISKIIATPDLDELDKKI